MKILVDADKLNEAFNWIADVKNSFWRDEDFNERKAAQAACDILGPMWAEGVDVRKVLVDAKTLYTLYDVLNNMKASQSNIIRTAKDMVSNLLPLLDINGIAIEDQINQEISDSAWKFVQGNTPYDITDDDRRWADEAIQKHDDSQIPVRSKKQNIQAIKDALAKDPGKISISPLPKGPPDPRCDGCEYQHPYAENLSYDIAAGKVYCNRGVTPTYYKEGRTIRYPPNLMICDMYYLNNGKLAKFGTEWNPPCAQYCIPEVEKLIEREVNNHRAIIDVLDMLMEHAKYHIEALGIDSKVFTMPLMFDAENLRNKLVEKQNENISG